MILDQIKETNKELESKNREFTEQDTQFNFEW